MVAVLVAVCPSDNIESFVTLVYFERLGSGVCSERYDIRTAQARKANHAQWWTVMTGRREQPDRHLPPFDGQERPIKSTKRAQPRGEWL